ncbi:hypothetical protein SK128_017546, partial [Halocaridina rubra]
MTEIKNFGMIGTNLKSQAVLSNGEKDDGPQGCYGGGEEEGGSNGEERYRCSSEQ